LPPASSVGLALRRHHTRAALGHARALTIAWAATALLVVTFLGLDLLGTLIGE